MPFQPVPFTASFRIVQERAAGQVFINTLYVRNTLLAWNTVNLGAMAATIGNAWRDQVMPLLSDLLVLDRVDARDEGAEFGAQTVTQYSTAGGDVAEDLPANAAALVQYAATTGAAPRRGRLFIAGLTIAATETGSKLTAAFQVALDAAITTVQNQIQGGANAQVLVSRFLNKVKRAEGATNTIGDITVRPIVASQRDRRPGEGS
jgi:hypothetical protein